MVAAYTDLRLLSLCLCTEPLHWWQLTRTCAYSVCVSARNRYIGGSLHGPAPTLSVSLHGTVTLVAAYTDLCLLCLCLCTEPLHWWQLTRTCAYSVCVSARNRYISGSLHGPVPTLSVSLHGTVTLVAAYTDLRLPLSVSLHGTVTLVAAYTDLRLPLSVSLHGTVTLVAAYTDLRLPLAVYTLSSAMEGRVLDNAMRETRCRVPSVSDLTGG